jgi:hypothetical protein
VLLVHWFVGCCLLLFGSTLQLVSCFCLIQLCRVGVMHLQLEMIFLLCGVQVHHPQFDLRFYHSSLWSKFRCHNFISIHSFLFTICNLQVRMFDYFYWHARHMFWVPFVLWMQFGNHWRHICCFLVQWFFLVRWFISSSVVACCCLVQVCEFEVLRLQLFLFVLPH